VKPEWVAVLVALAFLVGGAMGAASVEFYYQWTRKLDDDEREWKRAGWLLQIDRRREARRRFIADKGKSSW
jgi:hypothetical protein